MYDLMVCSKQFLTAVAQNLSTTVVVPGTAAKNTVCAIFELLTG
jgi:hypothetical protein